VTDPADDGVEIRRGEYRYELLVGGRLASHVELRPTGDRIVMPHTFTQPGFRGHGYAERVVRAALDDLVAAGERVVPSCWFVAEVIQRPEYRPLVEPG
jgi:predicted GNAT family acetyltransferase